MPKEKQRSNWWSMLNYPITGMGGIGAQICVQPIEFMKVRMQLASESLGSKNPLKLGKIAYSEEGILIFYTGLRSALIRQAVFCTLRMGLYYNFADCLVRRRGDYLPLYQKVLVSTAAATIGCLAALPCDVAMVRMQADGTLPPQQRRNYKGFIHACIRVTREEGFATLWKGALPTIGRSGFGSGTMMSSFDETKERVKPYLGDRLSLMAAVLVSGLVTTCCSLPFDNCKVKLQKMVPDIQGSMPYKGLIHCLFTTVRREGLFGLWSGFFAFYAYCAPHVIISLTIVDTLRNWLNVSPK